MQPRINSASKAAGFSLIELVITLALVSFLLLMGGSLTSAWIDRSKVDNAAAMLKSATSFARSTALRNPSNKRANEPAVAVCITNDNTHQVIRVLPINNAATPCPDYDPDNSDAELRIMEFSKGISIKQGSEKLECIAFNTHGLASTSPTCTGQPNTEVTIGRNSEESTIKLI